MMAALREPGEVSPPSIERVLTRADEMRVFPRVANELLALKQGRSAANRGLEQVISQDVVIAGRLVRVANSAFYGQKKQVSTLDAAIKVIGLYPARDLALSMALATARVGDAQILDLVWGHSARNAVVARVMAGAVSRRLGPSAFLAGLLHELGRLLLLAVDGERYARLAPRGTLPDPASERACYGYTSAGLGADCLAHWQLPDSIVWAVRMQHSSAPPSRYPMRPTEPDVLVAALMLGDALEAVCAAGKPDPVQRALDSAPARESLGIGAARVPGLTARLLEAVKESRLLAG